MVGALGEKKVVGSSYARFPPLLCFFRRSISFGGGCTLIVRRYDTIPGVPQIWLMFRIGGLVRVGLDVEKDMRTQREEVSWDNG